MLIAASTEARELELSIDSRIVADNNVFRSASDRVADGYLSLAPQFVLREAASDLNYRFRYKPTYETYFETRGIDGFDHRVDGFVSWRPNDVDVFALRGSLSNTRGVDLETQTGASSSGPVLEPSDREQFQRADARVSYSRELSRLLTLQSSASFDNFTSSRDESSDGRSYSGQLGMQFALSPTTSMGLYGTVRQRDNRRVNSNYTQDTETRIWNIAASLQGSLTRSLSISAQGGPSFISTTQEFSPAFSVFDSTSQTISYFLAFSIDKTWQHADFNFSFQRSESSGGSNSSSSINDNLVLDFNHRLGPRWSYRLYGSWLQSKQIAEEQAGVPDSGGDDTTQFYSFISFSRRISRQLIIVGEISFFQQNQTDSTTSESIGAVYSGFLSLRYTFDPVVF